MDSETTASSVDDEYLKVQINSIDSYQANPNVLDQGPDAASGYDKVSVLRVFGLIPTGHTVCVHVHGVLPYFFVELQYGNTIFKDLDDIQSFARNLHAKLEQMTRLSFKRKQLSADDYVDVENAQFDKETRKPGTGKYRYIANVQPCKAVSFYGYHVGYSVFFRIAYLGPAYKKRIMEVLLSHEMPYKFKVYEAHVPLGLQFMADFNLYGCGWLLLRKCLFRAPVFNTNDEFYLMKLNDDVLGYTNRFITRSNVLHCTRAVPKGMENAAFLRISCTFLEIDVAALWIANRDSIQIQNLHHDFVEKTAPDPAHSDFRYITSTKELRRDDRFHRKSRNIADYRPKQLFRRPVTPDLVQWADLNQLNDLFKYCVASARAKLLGNRKDYSNYIQTPPFILDLPLPFELILANFIEASLDQCSAMQPQPQAQPQAQAPELDYAADLDSEPSEQVFDKKQVQTSLYETLDDLDKPELTCPEKKPSSNVIENVSLDNMSFSFQEPVRKRPRTSLPKTRLLAAAAAAVRAPPPPRLHDIARAVADRIVPQHAYPDPHYGKAVDVPANAFIHNNKRYTLSSSDPRSLAGLQFKGVAISASIGRHNDKYYELSMISVNDKIILGEYVSQQTKVYRYVRSKPLYCAVQGWLKEQDAEKQKQQERKRKMYESQIEFHTPKMTQYKRESTPAKKRRPDGYNNVSVLAIETHISTEHDLAADPARDAVSAIFWKIDAVSVELDIVEQGILLLGGTGHGLRRYAGLTDVAMEVFDDELTMIKELVSLVKLFDPDVLAAYEMHLSAWGYVIDRCRSKFQYDVGKDLARVDMYQNNKARDMYGFTHGTAMAITGRHMVNIWRLVSKEIALTSYTLENVVHAVCKERIPHYSLDRLSDMFRQHTPGEMALLLNYYVNRVGYSLRVLDKLDIMFKTVEQARLGGIDFYSVFYRGLQYKVESFLLRICKAQHFLLLSPSKKDVRKQKPLQCIPLVMEPSSGFYKSPLVVLDFQSLYPSVIIAYNYCYSTCVGNVRGFRPLQPSTVGVNSFPVPEGLIDVLSNDMFVSPNGLMFVKPSVRRSLLAKMLEEILETRFMLKATMKQFCRPGVAGDAGIKRLYDSRQLALKLIANVTYGYTSATFSGRMPCSDIADAIVQTARETLERSVRMIEAVKEWNAKVVYGDTDSLFVYLPGKSRSDAFAIGREIAKQVSEANPAPITLNFEKVYHPCVLVAKKRYVGYSYESETQPEPTFDAKGIETVRRDGIPAQQKVSEKALRILFDTADVSRVKSYVKDQFYKIMCNKVLIQDFCFAKEIKIGSYKSEKSMPPGALLVTKKMNKDAAYQPQYRQRIPYVIMKTGPNDRLRDKAILLEDVPLKRNFQLDSEYYIRKTLIPPLERIFNLLGVDVKQWYYEMPRYLNYHTTEPDTNDKTSVNLLQKYLQVEKCFNCNRSIDKSSHLNISFSKFCSSCAENEPESMFQVVNKVKHAQEQTKKYYSICRDCSVNRLNASDVLEILCNNGDCPVYYSRVKAISKMQAAQKIVQELGL